MSGAEQQAQSAWDAAASSALATATASAGAGPTYTSDPVLALQPAFSYSLVGQLIANACIFTMLVVLIVHLLFTSRYHWPISKLNFSLQFSAAVTSLASSITTLVIIIRHTRRITQQWPYMFDYIESIVPPTYWSDAQNAGWSVLQALLTACCHLTHIQFLTLLFPSKLEERLIYALLAPLAFIAAGLEFPVNISNTPAVVDVTDAIRTTCNSSLTLLYSMGLLIWSLLLNRKRAWQAEGGTLLFGVMAISLALVGTAVGYLEIHVDQIQWLPGIVWCILLWQSWAGFWWWVGSGMYAGEVEDRERREARKRRREEKRRARKNRLPPLNEGLMHRFGRRVGVASGVEPRIDDNASVSTRRRRPVPDVQESIELRPLGAGISMQGDPSDASHETESSVFMRFVRRIPGVDRLVEALAYAHERAARRKADDQVRHAREQAASASPWGANERSRLNAVPPDVSSAVSTPGLVSNEPSYGDERGMGEEGWEEIAVVDNTPSPPRTTAGEGMNRYAWHWRGPIRRARLREVDTY